MNREFLSLPWAIDYRKKVVRTIDHSAILPPQKVLFELLATFRDLQDRLMVSDYPTSDGEIAMFSGTKVGTEITIESAARNEQFHRPLGSDERPAYYRDHYFLYLKHTFGLTPKPIAENWNSLSKELRVKFGVDCAGNVTIEVVKNALKQTKSRNY